MKSSLIKFIEKYRYSVMNFSKMKSLWNKEIDKADFDNNEKDCLFWFDSIRNKTQKSQRQNHLQKIRSSTDYTKWKKSVLCRDDYQCKDCKIRDVTLYAHHIKPFSKYPELRFDIDNGITLCLHCHAKVDVAFRQIMKAKLLA